LPIFIKEQNIATNMIIFNILVEVTYIDFGLIFLIKQGMNFGAISLLGSRD
jgi:hypothetical protein